MSENVFFDIKKLCASPTTMSRTDIINTLISYYKYESYLEIGYGTGVNYHQINIQYKLSIDPTPCPNSPPGCTHIMTSDAFFDLSRTHNSPSFDIIFIDGSHLHVDTARDLQNSLDFLAPNGTIIMHDCYPPTREYQIVPPPPNNTGWTGDVWKAFLDLRRTRADLEMFVVDTDYGCGIVRHGQQEIYTVPEEEDAYTYDHFEKNAQRLLNLISVEEFDRRYTE